MHTKSPSLSSATSIIACLTISQVRAQVRDSRSRANILSPTFILSDPNLCSPSLSSSTMSDDPRATYPASLPPPSYTLKNGLAQLDVSKFNFDVDSDSLYSPSENGTFLEELEGTSEGEGEHGRGGISAGRLPEEVYVSTLPRWRNALRRRLVSCVEWETGVLASMQVCLFFDNTRCRRTASGRTEGSFAHGLFFTGAPNPCLGPRANPMA